MSLDVTPRRDADLMEAERALIAEWEDDAYGDQTWAARYSWTPAGWRLLLRNAGRPVSHLKVVTRPGSVGGSARAPRWASGA